MAPALLARLLPRQCCGAPALERLPVEELCVDDPAGPRAPRPAVLLGRPRDGDEAPDAGGPPEGKDRSCDAPGSPDQASGCCEPQLLALPKARAVTASSTDLPSPVDSSRGPGLDTCRHRLPSSASLAAALPEQAPAAVAPPSPAKAPPSPAGGEALAGAAGEAGPPGPCAEAGAAGPQSPQAARRGRGRPPTKPVGCPPGEVVSPRALTQAAMRKRHSHKVTVHSIGSEVANRVSHLRALTRRRSSDMRDGKIVLTEAPQGVKPIFEKVVGATLDEIQAALLRTEQCPMGRFLDEILECYDIEPAEWKTDPVMADTMLLKRRYSAPVPDNVPDAVARIVRLPPVIGTTTVYRLRRSEAGELTMVQQSYTGDVMYGDRFKIQNTISFREEEGGVVSRQWADIVWDQPLPWTHSIIRHFIEKRSKADATRYAPQLLCMIEDAVEAL